MDDSLFNFFDGLNRLYTEQREMAAIIVTRPVVTSEGRTVRLGTGDLLRIEGDAIVDISEGKPATHKIILCVGTLYSKFELTLTDLKTSQPLIFKL